LSSLTLSTSVCSAAGSLAGLLESVIAANNGNSSSSIALFLTGPVSRDNGLPWCSVLGCVNAVKILTCGNGLFGLYLKNCPAVNHTRRESSTAPDLSLMATHRTSAFWIPPTVVQFAFVTPISPVLGADVPQSHSDLSQPESESGGS
jgi:hypothetical protein